MADAVEDRAEAIRRALLDAGERRFFLDAERFAGDGLGSVVLTLEFSVEADGDPPSAHERIEAALALEALDPTGACLEAVRAYKRKRSEGPAGSCAGTIPA